MPSNTFLHLTIAILWSSIFWGKQTVIARNSYRIALAWHSQGHSLSVMNLSFPNSTISYLSVLRYLRLALPYKLSIFQFIIITLQMLDFSCILATSVHTFCGLTLVSVLVFNFSFDFRSSFVPQCLHCVCSPRSKSCEFLGWHWIWLTFLLYR